MDYISLPTNHASVAAHAGFVIAYNEPCVGSLLRCLQIRLFSI